tara:strand:- start:3240 stop:4616 length:1377 start_codon:yes stop_codon:yes gene_type:complete
MLSIRNRIFKGGLVVAIGQIVGVFLSLIIQHFLAVNISQSEVGIYFLLSSLTSLISLVINLGMDRASVKLIAGELVNNNTARASEFAKRFLITVFINAFIFIIFYLLFINHYMVANLLAGLAVVPAILVALWIALESLKCSMIEIFRGLQKMTYVVALGTIVGRTIFALTLVGFSFFVINIDIEGIVFINCLITAFILIFGIVVLKNQLDFKVGLTAYSKELYKIGPPIMGILVISVLNREIDIWFVSFFMTEKDVAVYGAASRLVQFVTLSMIIVTSILPPIISELYATSKIDKLQNIMRGTTLICSLASFIVVLIFLFFGDSIVRFIYTDEYQEAHLLMIILGVGKLLGVVAGSSGLILMMASFQGLQFKVLLVTFVISASLSVVLIPYYGPVGAAVASAFGMTLQNIVMTFYVYKKLGIKVHLFYSPIVMRNTLADGYQYLKQFIRKNRVSNEKI